MIAYGAKVKEPDWYMLFRVTGSVFFRCLAIVLPLSLFAVLLRLFYDRDILTDVTAMTFLKDGASWGGFVGLVNFVTVFRLSQAYSKYWDAFSVTTSMLCEWSSAASSLVAFCRHAKGDPVSIDAFLHTAIRLFSMLSASALQELSPREALKIWGLLTLNSDGLDSKSIRVLDGSSRRVDLCYHWIQQLVVDGQESGIIAAPPPIVARVFGELTAGIDKFCSAKKHATQQFNFPYAQATAWLLVVYSIMLPLMMVQWSDWVVGAFIFTFLQLLFIWALHLITIILERPFESSNPNSIDVFQLQLDMNNSLLLLLHPETSSGPPMLEKMIRKADSGPQSWSKDYSDLHKRDTVHTIALKKEGWHIRDDSGSRESSRVSPRHIAIHDMAQPRKSWCSCAQAEAWQAPEIAVSGHYCTKRFGIIDGEKTAVLPICIHRDKLLIALPPSVNNNLNDNVFCSVHTTNGQRSNVVIKSMPIQARHRLFKDRKMQYWFTGDYQDFPFEYADLVGDVSTANTNLAEYPMSLVSTRAEVLVEAAIRVAKEKDKVGVGIESMMNLKPEKLFCSQLIEKCGLDQSAARAEWNRRKNSPDEYEQGKDVEGELIIELDIEAFKLERDRKEKAIRQAIEMLQSAEASASMADLEAAMQKAEADKMSFITSVPESQLAPLRTSIENTKKILDKLHEVDISVREALGARNLQSLRQAIQDAHRAKLVCGTVSLAEETLHELECDEVRRSLDKAKLSRVSAELDCVIKEAEALRMHEERDQAQRILHEVINERSSHDQLLRIVSIAETPDIVEPSPRDELLNDILPGHVGLDALP